MRRIKQAIALLASFLFAVVVLTGCSQSGASSSSRDEADLARFYLKQNVFLVPSEADYYYPFNERMQNYVLEYLFYYHWQTGKKLSLEDVQLYLACEYEEDGSVRIYNNGNWSDIEAYVDWCWNHKKEVDAFQASVIHKQTYWAATYPQLWAEHESISPHNLNEIMLTMQDESYEPNFIFV